jgi:hypothetical protein
MAELNSLAIHAGRVQEEFKKSSNWLFFFSRKMQREIDAYNKDALSVLKKQPNCTSTRW